MKKYTYYLGAGSSVNSLPIVNGIQDEWANLIGILKNTSISDGLIKYISLGADVDFGEITDHFLSDFHFYLNELSKTYSIDTLARMYYLKGDMVNYEKIKYFMQVFFSLLQTNRNPDYRYELFWATILSGGGDSSLIIPPGNVNIISWNYDIQLEKSFYQFQKPHASFSEFMFNILNIYPNKQMDNVAKNTVSIFKLNGTCTNIFRKNEGLDYGSLNRILTDGSFESVFAYFLKLYAQKYKLNYKFDPVFYFGWEANKISELVRNKSIESTSETEVLIVIGYSFPNYNRKIDMSILEKMAKLKTVYVQVPSKSFPGIQTRLGSILSGIQIINIDSCDEFFIDSGFYS